MAVQKGKDLLIKIDLTGAGTFMTFAGLRASKIAFNAQTVDVTNMSSAGGWRELLAGSGVRSATVSGSGVFLDDVTDERARMYFFDAEIPEFQVIIPELGTLTGKFQITALEYSGNHDGEATYELTLASAGELTFSSDL